MSVLGRVLGCGVLVVGVAGRGIAQADGSQAGKPTVVRAVPARPQAGIDKKVPVLGRRISLADFEGMRPKEELRGELTEIGDFVQSSPIDGNAATQKTVAWVGRTSSALYVVFACYDTHPALIRSHMARRENILTDDTVSVLVDPFQDRRRGILFQVNPVGVQADAAYSESGGTDYSYDQVWDSEGRTTAQGWMALFAIPFKSLRFRPGGEDWGVVLTRSLPRNSETDNWPHISTNVTGTLAQEGTLRGIEGVTGSHNLQINPYVLGQNEKTLLDLDPLDPSFSSRHFEGTAGGEVKAVVKDEIVFDVTVNPDFSDIESDQPQFTVNQRYPVYFPELRPFFLENANYFATPITLLYTRTIVRPEFGARVTGKVGGTNVGLLLSDDREPGETVAPGDPEYGKKALVAVGRVTQDIGKGSSVGVMYTDEEFGGGWNRIGGVDYTARITEHWTSMGQIVESSTKPSSAVSGGAGGGRSGGAERACAEPVRRVSGHQRGVCDDGGFFAVVEYPQRPSACELPVVSEEERGAELWAGDEPADCVRPPGPAGVSLLDVRPVLGAAAEYGGGADLWAELGFGGAAGGVCAGGEQELYGELWRAGGAERAVFAAEREPAGDRRRECELQPGGGGRAFADA
jgi:hypothetical protein